MKISARSALSILAAWLTLTAPLAAASAAPPAQPDDAKEAAQKDAPKWDVENPPGPSHLVDLDADEGTWMAVDLAPDGKEIVFDLLGDLYVIPSAGGEAKALTTGLAWDMQPRFSPDGKWIAFTSDRAGGDNLWIMKRDGSAPQQVSKESFRLVNSPAWSPDSQFLLGRKHFTAERSLGAGEIWIWHRSGGDGLQLTEKQNDQKDTGEPAFSPDGRYVYFSQDTTPGKFFEYNKDPNGEIYAIRRLDRQTGEIEDFVGGPGGAIRPTPSPNGRMLAFVRRVRGVSTLWLHDVESGVEKQIFAPLERDLQETWAIQGVYPGMGWSADSRALVFWAGGQIHRLDVASKKDTIVPFHVKAQRKVMEALRSPVDVAPAKFGVKMLRWVEVAPKGDRVVYQALGKIWLRDLPKGTPHRLTTDDNVFEYYPSFSRDGKDVVYVTYDDEKHGSVRVAPVDGGFEPTVLTEQPGRYLEPVFTPDGERVVYRKAASDDLFGRVYSHGTGIYVVSAEGGRSRLLTKEGIAPQFGADEHRVYLTRIDDEDERSLVSLELDGSDLHTHVSSDAATEMRVSPDGQWLAFAEGFTAYVTPFVPTGKTVEIGPKMTSLPVSKVSHDAGEYLHWSGDSKRLYWALGPELFSRDLKDSFAFVAGAPPKLPETPASGFNISFAANADHPSGSVLAFVGGRVIPMKGDQVIEDGAVLVEGNRIKAVGPRAEVKVPKSAKVIDVAGATVMPGLIDVHWHGAQGSAQLVPRQSWVNYASLAFGVPTLHDPSNDTGEIFAASELQKAGQIVAPRIFSTGMILYGAKGSFKAEIDSLDDARAHLKRMKAVGAFSVKSYNQPRRDQRQQVIAAARELGLMVVPEGGSLYQMDMSMVADGHTGIEHAIPVPKLYEDVIQLWRGTKVGYTPTLIVAYGGMFGENYWYQHTNVWEDERLSAFVPPRLLDERSRRRVMAPEAEYNHPVVAAGAKALADAGVAVLLGAHGQREGLGAHWELWMMAQGGMSPLQALTAGTIAGARYLGLDKDLGSLEPGKLADLIVLDKNPLEDIRNSESVRWVLLDGRLYDAKTLDQVAPQQKKRAKFYFED